MFQDYNFTIEDQGFVCFSGASGTGKTTLLNMIGLIEPIDSGTLKINGIEYRTSKQKMEYFRTVVGFLFQNYSRTDYSIEEVLERVGLTSKLNSKVYTLSGGEQQRIALARLFLKKCDIILADEPTGSLDAKNAEIIMDILHSMNLEGKTIIIVTHDQKIKDRAKAVIEL